MEACSRQQSVCWVNFFLKKITLQITSWQKSQLDSLQSAIDKPNIIKVYIRLHNSLKQLVWKYLSFLGWSSLNKNHIVLQIWTFSFNEWRWSNHSGIFGARYGYASSVWPPSSWASPTAFVNISWRFRYSTSCTV